MIKCRYCKKDFEPKVSHQVFCCEKCKKKDDLRQANFNHLVKRIAKNFNFDVQNKDKILKAKKMLFGDDMKRCPCDAKNPERYCGSALCIHDVVAYGHCHCNLFHKKHT